MRVLFATSEAYPLAKTGGLADVSRALPAALQRHGVDVRVILQLREARVTARLNPALGVEDGLVVSGFFPDCDIQAYLVSSAGLFGRDGGLYQDANGQDWPDNAHRFAFFSKIVTDIALGRTDINWAPDVVHANDWHTGLVPLLLSQEEGTRPHSIFTTHNMAFQGNFAAEGLSEFALDKYDVEFYGRVSFLKAGLAYADRVTTVSPTYAKEILTAEYGCGLEGVLQQRGSDFTGILNGIEEQLWNPATDPWIEANYNAANYSGKRLCKQALQGDLSFPILADTPLVGFVSRLTEQKMADTLVEILPWVAEQNLQLVVVGEGDRTIEAQLQNFAQKHPDKISVTIGYDEQLAHKLQAGADILLSPARFEPCGLTQLYALRYGTLPVVRRTGGLADTVVDANNHTISDRTASGFVFDNPDAPSMIDALLRALTLYRDHLHWRILQLQAMTRSFSWDKSAAAYMALYEEVTGKPSHQAAGNQEGTVRRAAG